MNTCFINATYFMHLVFEYNCRYIIHSRTRCRGVKEEIGRSVLLFSFVVSCFQVRTYTVKTIGARLNDV